MTFALRPYQVRVVQELRDALREVDAVIAQMPTGAGKTALAGFMAGSAAGKRRRVTFGVHRRELVKQTAETFDKVGIPFGIIASGMTPDPRQLVQIASIQTLHARLDRYPVPDLYIPDEAHHCGAKTWQEISDHYLANGAKMVGLSATPERLDGKGLDSVGFKRIVNGPPVSWLIENGFLSPYRLFAPSIIDVEGIKRTGGDFNRAALEERASKPAITGDAVAHYTKLAHGKRAMVFCVSIKHSLGVVEQFQAAGYRAAHIDGDSPNRDELIEAFKLGRIQVLSSVDLVSEGFDLPAMEVAILLRPTASLGLYLQQVGRALRTAPGKAEALILDHAGNSIPRDQGGRGHGLPDDERAWTLAGRVKRRRGPRDEDEEPAVQTRQCPTCFRVHQPAPECPGCGHRYPVLGRTVEQLEGELAEVNKAEARKQRVAEERSAQTVDDLIRIGKLRGYKNPAGWARRYFEEREKRRSTRYA